MIAPELLQATEEAALACWPMVGLLKKEDADRAAVTAMRRALDRLPFSLEVVIGEGEMDEAPMLYRGERLGSGGAAYAIAVDPLEGTNLTAKNQPGASCILAAAPMGALFSAPDMYMERLAAPPAARGRVSLGVPVSENVREVARALHKEVRDVTVVMLDRERHRDQMEAVLSSGARLRLITDGDTVPCVLAGAGQRSVDLVLGSGGAPEGVLAACAIRVLGGVFEGRLLPRTDEEREVMDRLGLTDRVLGIDEIVRDPVTAFAATAVTHGWGLEAPSVDGRWIWTSSYAADGPDGTLQIVRSRHPLEPA